MLYMEPQAGVAPILRAIAQAHARGVNVQVMISGKPYGLSAAQVRHEGTGLCTSGARGLSRRRGENSWGAAAAWDGHDRGRGTGLLPGRDEGIGSQGATRSYDPARQYRRIGSPPCRDAGALRRTGAIAAGETSLSSHQSFLCHK